MSALTSAAARSWSIVSSYGNDASISACQGVSGANAWPCALGARGVQREQLLGQVVDRLADALLGAQPFGAAELGQRRSLAAGIARDPADLLDRHEDPVAARERQLEVVAILAGAAAPEHLLVARDAVVDVDDEVARASAARGCRAGTTRRRARGRRTRTVPNSSRSVTKARPSGPPTKPPLRLRSMRAIAPGGGASADPIDDRDRRGRPRRGGPRGAAPGPRRGRSGRRPRASASTASARRPARPGGRTGSRQPNGSPDDSAAAGHRDVLGRDGFPGQLERPRGDEAALPVARREVGRRPVLGQLAGLDELGAALVGLAPQERRRPRRCRPARRGRAACPGRCGRGRSPGRGGRPRPRPRRRRPSPGSHRPSAPGGLGQRLAHRTGRGRRPGAPGVARPHVPSRSRIAAAPPAGSRNSEAGRSTADSIAPTVRWSVGSNERSESISSPKNSIRIGSGSDGGKTSTMPPRRAEFAAPGDLDDRHVAEVEQLAQQRVLVDPRAEPELARRGRAGRPGSIVCWRSAWTLATRIARPAAPPGREGRDPGRGLVGDELAPLVGERGPRLEDGDRRRDRPARRPAPRPPGRRSRRRARSRPAARRLAEGERRGEVGLGAVRHGDEPDVAAGPSRVVVGRPEALAERRERAGRGEQWRERGQVRQPVAAAAPGPAGVAAGSAGRGGRPVAAPAPARRGVLDLGVDLGDVEVDAPPRAAVRVTRGEVGRDPLGDPAVAAAPATERGVRHVGTLRRPACRGGSGASRSASGGCPRRRAARRPRRARRAGSCRPAAARTC